MDSPTRLLFVCLGNICRSPAGENVMNHLIGKEGLESQFVVDSAGTAGYHIGNPPDLRMGRAAKTRGIAMCGRARQVKPSDFSDFDWIFAMDRSNYDDLVAVRKNATPLPRSSSFSATSAKPTLRAKSPIPTTAGQRALTKSSTC